MKLLMLGGLMALATLAYANHFTNGFHFDDSHAVEDNPYIRDLHNLPRIFTDADTFSTLPANRAWRPLVTASLAIDYWLAGGLKPAYFQASTFFWYLIQLCLIFALFLRISELTRRDASPWLPFFATALYAVHPATAETLNYIVQRGDVYSTLGVIAGLVIWVYRPGWRRYGIYLIPVVAALLSKPPALVFPAILFAYIWLFEEVTGLSALSRCLPALAVTAAMAAITGLMTPKTYTSGAVSAAHYLMTQPLVALRYFRTFFLPTTLSADTDHSAVASIFDDYAWLGFVFLAGLIATAVWCTKKRELKPVAFGLFWFVLALLPTSVFPLAEVENDHRMFFPFVGLSLSVCWAAAIWIDSRRIGSRRVPRELILAGCGLILAVSACGTWNRNVVWHSEESLWRDVTVKSPRNGRGLMNYGLTLMSRGDYTGALDYFQRALLYTPNYMTLEVNLGVVNGALHNDAEAERHFGRALQLAPSDAVPNYFYAVWLRGKGRLPEAVQHLKTAVAGNPSYLLADYLLMDVYTDMRDAAGLRAAAQSTLAFFPADAKARAALAGGGISTLSADDYLNQSLLSYQQGKFKESIAAAQEALKLRPGYAEAWNNIAASYNSLRQWDEGIHAASEAVRLRPDFQLARNNLAWALQQKQFSRR